MDHPRFLLNDTWPGPTTLAEYTAEPSTKLDIISDILEHHKLPNRRPLENVCPDGATLHDEDDPAYQAFHNALRPANDKHLLPMPLDPEVKAEFIAYLRTCRVNGVETEFDHFPLDTILSAHDVGNGEEPAGDSEQQQAPEVTVPTPQPGVVPSVSPSLKAWITRFTMPDKAVLFSTFTAHHPYFRNVSTLFASSFYTSYTNSFTSS